MARDVLTIAWKYIRRRRFSDALKLLDSRAEIYADNFEYYITTAIACLYVGDIGASSAYFQRARKIKLMDTRLLLGQAAIFLRRGDTERALAYYLEVKDNDPGNKIATEAMEFIRLHGDYDTICRWVDSGRIERFYPPIGMNPMKIVHIVLPLVFCALACTVTWRILSAERHPGEGPRLDVPELVLSKEEKENAQETDLSGGTYHYILTEKEITRSYSSALEYFQANRDNAAQVEINRILNSNASVNIKQKSRVLMGYLAVPTFDTLTDNPTFAQVENSPELYLDCWVSWSGRISDAVSDGKSYSCRLLVGYESMKSVEGIITVRFEQVPEITPDQPVRILGKIATDTDGKMFIKGLATYQSVRDALK